MLLRQVLLFILILLAARLLWRVVGGVMQRLSERQGTGGNVKGIQMVRDPVCGTFVVPDRAVMLADGSRQVYFCSANCRDQYRARSA